MLALERAAGFDPVVGRLFQALEALKTFAKPRPHQVGKANILIGKPLLKRPDLRSFLSHVNAPLRIYVLYRGTFYMSRGDISAVGYWPVLTPSGLF